MRFLIRAFRHKLLICNKRLAGYTCYGRNNYNECR
jgi:hypothetical protein